ncbi:hypothetical protein BH09BAC6_BH09BAC6_14660 [soil metagenome]|jgi:hypothetical protein
MSKMFWFKICPFCKQGRLFILKNLDTGKPYLHCEECERGYLDIYNVDIQHSFLTVLEDFEATAATEKDISGTNWTLFKFHVVDE